MFRFINSQVFKPTRMQYHRPRTGVDHVWRSISTTPKRSAGGPKRAKTGPKSGPSPAGTKSQTPLQQAADVTQECSGGSGNVVSGEKPNKINDVETVAAMGKTYVTNADRIRALGTIMNTRFDELVKAISEDDGKVDAQCRNLAGMTKTDCHLAQETSNLLYDFLGRALFRHYSCPPAPDGKEPMSPPTAGISSSTTEDSK
ncbi:hypothetical protein HOY82DRAFT_476151 [Tuber indicum]|nr:hypothetical protein HOY82DRAFT_476151 [Tuber indicum]